MTDRHQHTDSEDTSQTHHSKHTPNSIHDNHSSNQKNPHTLHHKEPKDLPPAPVVKETQIFNPKYIIAFITIIVIFLAAILSLNRKKSDISNNQTTPINSIEISQETIPTIDSNQTSVTKELYTTLSWLDYTSPKKDFSLKYPNEKYIEIDTVSPQLDFCNIGKSEVAIRIYPRLYQKPIFEFDFHGELMVTVATKDNVDNLLVDEWVEQNCDNSWLISGEPHVAQKVINIDNETAVQYSANTGKNKNSGQLVIIPHNDKLYFVHGWPYEENLFNLVLSTFRFLQ